MYNRKKKNNKTLAQIGTEKYKFDFYSEQIIYKDLCCLRLNWREKRKLSKLQKYYRYRDWKNYIEKKYKAAGKEALIEFSRYLNQQLRNREISRDYWKLAIPVVFTISVTEVLSKLLPILYDMYGEYGNFVNVIVVSLAIVLFMIFIMFVIWNTMEPMWESNTEKNFLSDYKEIIDELIRDNQSV